MALLEITPSELEEGLENRILTQQKSLVRGNSEENKESDEKLQSSRSSQLKLEEKVDSDKYLVTFDGPNDPYNPLNWSFRKKALTTMVYAAITFGPQFASSSYGATVEDIEKLYSVSREVAVLGVSLFVMGVGLGPMIFAPISEVYGRKIGCLIPFFLSGLFAIGCAAASNIQTVIIMRFFQGLFGGAPVSNSGGVLGDIWSPDARAIALVCYGFVVAGGPTISPVISGAIAVSGPDGWRWVQYLTAIYAFVMATVAFLFIDETYHPVLLQRKARKLRLETLNWAYHSPLDEWDLTFKEVITKHLTRPFLMLATPIVTAMCIYASFTFGILYLGVVAIPVEFRTVRQWPRVTSDVPTIAMFVGIVSGGLVNIYFSRRYGKVMKANNGKPIPEKRLEAMRIGCFLLPSGLFIFGWTSDPKYPWIAPVIGIYVFSSGFFIIFQGCLNYLIDTFLRFSASAIATATFTRSCFAAAFPLFGTIMFNNLGVNWGASLVGFIAVAMIPIPFIFSRYGAAIRSRNPYSAQVM
ncbi:major facilitator superfamily domain-containing protein [Dipodascopsis uninucleata]